MPTIAEDWATIRARAIDIWSIVHADTMVELTTKVAGQTILIPSGLPDTIKFQVTDLARDIRTVARAYPNTCSGAVRVTFNYNPIQPAAPPNPPILEPVLPPTTPPSDNDQTFVV